MSAHTPGPWRAAISDAGGFQIEIGDTDLTYCVICQRADWGHRAAESAANAHLIAAAPSLLSALRALMREYVPADDSEPDPKTRAVIDQCRAAITKATP